MCLLLLNQCASIWRNSPNQAILSFAPPLPLCILIISYYISNHFQSWSVFQLQKSSICGAFSASALLPKWFWSQHLGCEPALRNDDSQCRDCHFNPGEWRCQCLFIRVACSNLFHWCLNNAFISVIRVEIIDCQAFAQPCLQPCCLAVPVVIPLQSVTYVNMSTERRTRWDRIQSDTAAAGRWHSNGLAAAKPCFEVPCSLSSLCSLSFDVCNTSPCQLSKHRACTDWHWLDIHKLWNYLHSLGICT